MFDDLRDQASSSPFFQEDLPQEDLPPEEMAEVPAMRPIAAFESGFAPDFTTGFESEFEQPPAAARFLGMTAIQRFIIALLLFLAVCVIGASFLVITGKIYLSLG